MNMKNFKQSHYLNWYTILWTVALLLTFYLYYAWHVDKSYIGIVEKKSHSLGPQEPGRVNAVLVEVGEKVDKDQVLAFLDMPDLNESLTRLKNEWSSIQQLNQSQHQVQAIELQRIRMQTENEFANLIDRLSVIESKMVELDGLNKEIKRLENAEEAGLGYSRDLSALTIQRDALEGYLDEQQQELDRLTRNLDQIRDSRKSLQSADVDSMTRSLMLEHLEYAESINREIILTEQRIRMRTLYSPCEGYVTDVIKHPGDVIQDFDSLLVVEELQPKYLTVYLPEKTQRMPLPGMQVKIFSSRQRSLRTSGTVSFVHPGYAKAGQRLSFRGQIFWARKVRVQLSENHQLLPGEVVTVRIPHRWKRKKQSSPDLQAAESQPPLVESHTSINPELKSMQVPDELWKQTRFEPSGIVWIDDLDRYLIVSDDTGMEEKKTDHASWLFTMDQNGAVDASPLSIFGMREVNDLESVTYAGDSVYYLCSSQNISKKEKRPENREFLIQMKSEEGRFRAAGKIHLLSLIENYPATEKAALGLIRTEADGRPEINIEGMTYKDNTLYFGLKQPLSDGRAMIWRLTDARSLFKNRRLASGQLSLFGTVDLGSYKGTNASISDLFMDKSGTLWALSTIAKADNANQMGGFHRIDRFSDGRLTSKRLASFPGVKPEGLCLNSRGQFVIVVDMDNQTPLYCVIEKEDL